MSELIDVIITALSSQLGVAASLFFIMLTLTVFVGRRWFQSVIAQRYALYSFAGAMVYLVLYLIWSINPEAWLYLGIITQAIMLGIGAHYEAEHRTRIERNPWGFP